MRKDHCTTAMSTIPRAKWCTVSDLTVTPEKWESYPVLDRSTIRSSHFKDLSSSTCIKGSSLDRVTVQSEGKGSHIKGCSLTDSLVSDSNIKRSKISGSSFVAVTQARWLRTQNSSFTHVKKMKRTKCEDSSIRNTAALKSSSVKRSVIADSSVIKRSVLEDVEMRASSVQRSVLRNCDITDCDISRTNFSGMTLKYGVWRNGELVGKMGGKEVVAVSRSADLPLQAKVSVPKQDLEAGHATELAIRVSRQKRVSPLSCKPLSGKRLQTQWIAPRGPATRSIGNLQIPVLQTRLQMTHPTITGNCTLTFLLLLIRHNT